MHMNEGGQSPAAEASRIPVFILTGFLGAGKTTLLRDLLLRPEFAYTAVIINEVGEAVVDRMLFDGRGVEPILLEGGCICCALVEDVGYTLRDLHEKRRQGLIAPFRRVIIETTGIADPAPVIQRILTDAWISRHFTVGPVLALADVSSIGHSLETTQEAAVQIALADRVVLTKADLVAAEAVATAEVQVRGLNPQVRMTVAEQGVVPSDFILSPRSQDATWQAETLPGGGTDFHHGHLHDGEEHAGGLSTASVTIAGPLMWADVARTLDCVFNRHRTRLLRVKGVLDIAGVPGPVAINGVQGVFYPPEVLPGWCDAQRQCRIVLIGKGIDPEQVVSEILEGFGAAAASETSN